MIYLLGWLSIYYAWGFAIAARYRGRAFIFASLVTLSAIAFLRGDIGTDTRTYEALFRNFFANYRWEGIEPGFVVLSWSITALSPSIEMAVRAVSLVFFGAIARFAWRSDQNERTALLLYFLPVFAYPYAMNALRAGLAFALILLAAQALRRSAGNKAALLGASSILCHYSALIPLAYLVVTRGPWLRFSNMLLLAILMGIIGIGTIGLDEYLGDKLAAYRAMPSPSALSGVSIVVPLIVVLTGTLFGRLPMGEKRRLVALGATALGSGWLLTRFSYAGLRVLDLLAYAIPLSVLMAYSRHKLRLDHSMTCALLLAGLLSIAASYYRFTVELHRGNTEWLPYRTWLLNF